MDLVDFMRRAEDSSLKDLENRLREVLESIGFLSDYWLLADTEISVNNTAFHWYHRIPKILEDSRQIVEAKTQEFQETLKGHTKSRNVPITFELNSIPVANSKFEFNIRIFYNFYNPYIHE